MEIFDWWARLVIRLLKDGQPMIVTPRVSLGSMPIVG